MNYAPQSSKGIFVLPKNEPAALGGGLKILFM
jgi:hypothetical protein